MPNAKEAKGTTANRILLLGDTGAGKTSQFLTLPGKKFAYLFDANALLSLQGYDVEYEEFLPDRLNLSVKSLSKGKGDSTTNYTNNLYQAWERDFDARIKGGFFDDVAAILFDSATTFLDLIMDRVLTINGRSGSWPQQDDYGPQMLVFNNVCRTLVSLGIPVMMTGHIEAKKDELVGRIFREPMMTGRLKKKIPLLFSDIFVCGVENDGRGNVKHVIQTKPDRITTAVRTSMKGLDPFHDVTIDWNKSPEGQGIGGLINERKN